MSARDDDRAMDGLLRRSLARDAAKTGDCPDADILAAYYERSLDADEIAACEQHISQCARCREHLAAILHAQAAAEVPEEQVLVAAAVPPQRANVAGPASIAVLQKPAAEKPARSWAFDWRWFAPAAAILIFAAIVSVRVFTRGPNSLLSRNEVAVSKLPSATSPAPVAAPDLYAPAPRSQAPQKPPANPPSTLKSNAPPPPLEKELAAPPAPVRAPATHRPPPAYSASPPPRASSGANVTHGSPGSSSRFIGGGTPRRGAAAGTAASRSAPAPRQQTNATPPASASAKTAQAGQRAGSAIAAGAVSGAAAPPPPPPADAKKESEVADSSAPAAQATTANAQAKAPAEAGGLAGGKIGSVTETVEVSGEAESVAVSEKTRALFRVTPQGLVERSSDGGATWRPERLKTKATIIAASAPTGEIWWLVGRDGAIFVTKNARKWKKISPPAAIDFVGVTALDARSATVTAADGRKFSTTDGGKTWEQLKE